MRVRIRRFGKLRFPEQADLSTEAPSSPSVPGPHFTVRSGITLPSSESSADVRGHLGSAPEIRGMHSPLRSALRGPGVDDAAPLLWPLLTSRSAAYTSPSASPFQA